MSEDTKKKFKNSFHIRIYDTETLKSLNELLETNNYESMNELLNSAINIGVEKIYLAIGKRKLLNNSSEIKVGDSKKLDELKLEVKKVRTLEEDMYILMNSIKALTASIYNVQRAVANGETVSVEMLDNYGYMSTLPDTYREIEDKLIARFNRSLTKQEK